MNEQHQFEAGVTLFSETLCKHCYRPVFHDCHNQNGRRKPATDTKNRVFH